MDRNNLTPDSLDLNRFPNSFLDNFERRAYAQLNDNHPLHDIDFNHLRRSTAESDARIAKCFGSQEALKNSIERNMCAQATRLPGIKSSMLSLEILMDELDTVQSYDYMNHEKPTNEFGLGGIHSHVEDAMKL